MRQLIALSLLSSPVFAADCTRADIDHFLDRGFTPDQVVALCASPAPAESPADVSERAVITDALAAYDISLDREQLQYRRDQCFRYGRENLAQQRTQVCGTVVYRIALAGLEILDSRSKLLIWGRNSVAVSGDVQRDYQLDLAGLSQWEQAQLAKELEHGPQTELPVRDGQAADRVADALRDWLAGAVRE